MQGYDPDTSLSGPHIREGLLDLEPVIGHAMTEVLLEEVKKGLELRPDEHYTARAVRDVLREIIGIEGAEAIVARIIDRTCSKQIKKTGNGHK